MNNSISNLTAEDIERELNTLELVSTGALPISALASALTIIGLLPLSVIAIPIGSFVALTVARQYIKSRSEPIVARLEQLKASGELDDKKYQELLATLNKLTSEGNPRGKSEGKGE